MGRRVEDPLVAGQIKAAGCASSAGRGETGLCCLDIESEDLVAAVRLAGGLEDQIAASEAAIRKGEEAKEISAKVPGNLNGNRDASWLFNGRLSPVVPYAIRGAIWYQGESNVERAHQYRELLPAMIADWRRLFGQGDFPF